MLPIGKSLIYTVRSGVVTNEESEEYNFISGKLYRMLSNRLLCAYFTITMVQYNDLLGSLLIGSWLSMMLYGVVVCKIWEYLEWYPASGDARVRNGLLFCCTVTSSIAMVTQLTNVYYLTVSLWGNAVAIQTQYWPVPVYIVANSLTGVMVHTFLIHRVYSLSRILWISVFLAFSVVLGFVGAIMLAVNIATAAALSSRDKGVTAATLWAAGSATADVLIAAVLIWKLTTMRTSFKRTNSLIQRLVVGAVQTGSTTSTAAVATMVSYYILKNNSNVATAIYYLIGPLYMLTLLYNFNLRQYRDRIDINVSGSTDTRLTGPDAISMDAIHFHRTAIVSIDLPDEDASRSRVDTATKLSQHTEGGSFAAKGGRAGRADLSGAKWS
ncbi:hypothetical protein DFH08DRAFT_902186 [Mycena albidolilacea]|uniref:DUF6534 domain-containing protein n=1 Tax=Mycena albidolilacea TaxID=1033008 RepID=A0AAD6Z4I7_9AGAR|nr:hypothetical protein DFH08DRAFT_902186 [Mycena albidolilacea]